MKFFISTTKQIFHTNLSQIGKFDGYIPIVYASSLWKKNGDRSEPDIDTVRSYLSETFADAPPEILTLNIEHWPVGENASAEEISSSTSKLIEIIDAAKEVLPEVQIGLYSTFPYGHYWNISRGKDGAVEKFLAHNEMASEIANHIDIIFPSLYSYYNEFEEWRDYANILIDYSQSFGKPVIPFINPKFHPYNKELAWKAIPEELFVKQMNFVSTKVEAVQVWDTYKNINDEWVKDLSNKIEDHRAMSRPIVDVDMRLQMGILESPSIISGIDKEKDPINTISASFIGDGTDKLISFSAFDVDTGDEVEVRINGNTLGFLHRGENLQDRRYVFEIEGYHQNLGENKVEFIQSKNPKYVWGISDVIITEHTLEAELKIDEIEQISFGEIPGISSSENGVFSVGFIGSEADILMSFKLFDVDVKGEVLISLNQEILDFSEVGSNGKFVEYNIVIPKYLQESGINEVSFFQAINLNYSWGVSDIVITKFESDFTLNLGELNGDAFGNNFHSAKNDFGFVSAEFVSSGSDIILSFFGFDIDTDKELAVYVNDNLFKYLDAGLNQDLTPYHMRISKEYLTSGLNSISFSQKSDRNFTWGVTDVMIEEDHFDFHLAPGSIEQGSFGNKFNGSMDENGYVSGKIQHSNTDLQLNFMAFDVDTKNEVEVKINGVSLGFIDRGINEGLNEYQIIIDKSHLNSVDDRIEFIQSIDLDYSWGITSIYIDEV